ncbi:MAG: hypothetical protein JNL45_10675 [Hyphomicrobium sp.]|jgi:hypothetical protein|nr:hypothetical protein [Hyphomicrobium sp.]
MKKFIVPAIAVAGIAMLAVPVAAGPATMASRLNPQISNDMIQQTASHTKKPSRHQAHARLKGNGRVVKDTCPGGDKKCIKDLIAACDKAGGGLSTQPDGGVDCYVVGIHDQP